MIPKSNDAQSAPAPSWGDFCARIKQCVPALMPDETDSQWQNLYGVYQLGYSSALEAVMKTLERENVEVCDGGRKASELKQDANRHSQH